MTTRITKPGLYRELVTERAYHADPVASPSLSSSVAKLLLEKTPLHAWVSHPRLNPNYEPDESEKYDLGKTAHALMLCGEDAIAVVDADSYRSNAAKKARDDARESFKIPILASKLVEVKRMVEAGREQIDRLTDPVDRRAFVQGTGRPEQTLVWREDEAWCRARLDWDPDRVPDEPFAIHDYKTTSASAHPEEWVRTLYNMQGDVQAGFYRRGIRAVLGVELPDFRFIVQEIKPPYALSCIALSPGALDMAERKAIVAIDLWKRCTTEKLWPGYPAQTYFVDPPRYEESRWIEREEAAKVALDSKIDLFKRASDWQAPLNWEK